MKLDDLRKQRNQKKLDLTNRTKIGNDELIGKELTVVEFSTFQGRNGKTGIVIFKELPDKFGFSNSILTGVLDEILLDDEAMDDFKLNGLKVRYEKRHSAKSGNDYINVTLL